MKIYAIMDNALQRFMQPFFTHANAAAIRAFRDHVNEKGSPTNMHPDDYTLYYLGDFNEENGRITPEPTPLINAVDLLNGHDFTNPNIKVA